MLQTRNVDLCKSDCFKKKWECSLLIFPILPNTCRYLYRDLTNSSETTTKLWIKPVSVTRQPDGSVLPRVQCSICKLNSLHSNDLPRKRAKQQLNNKSLSSVGKHGVSAHLSVGARQLISGLSLPEPKPGTPAPPSHTQGGEEAAGIQIRAARRTRGGAGWGGVGGDLQALAGTGNS